MCCLVEHVALIEQDEARLAPVADAARDAGKEGHQRGFPGVGQDVGGVIVGAGETATQRTPGGEIEFAVAKGVVDDRVDLGHPRQQGRTPVGGEDVDPRAGIALLDEAQQRLGDDRVADPGRRDDQYLHVRGGKKRRSLP